MKKIFFLLIFFILTISLYSVPVISFEKEIHDFGDILEDEGPYECEFAFSNTGDEPLTVQKVKAGWGCTTPSWSTGLINPGEKGFVKVKYTSENRPGRFSKKITIISDAENSIIDLYVKGKVIPTPGKLRKRIGLLNSSFNRLDFKDVFFPNKITQIIEIENPTKGNMNLGLLYSPEYISVKIVPEILKSKQRGELIVTFNSKDKKNYGRSTDKIKLVTKEGERNITGVLTVTSNMKEDFSHFSAQQLADAPVIYFPQKSFDIGEIESRKSIEIEFENRGKSELLIRNVTVNNISFTLDSYDEIIEPGNKGKIKVFTNPSRAITKLNASIIVISNDPKRSESILRVYGTIKQPKPEIAEIRNKQTSVKNIEVQDAYDLVSEYQDSDKLIILDIRTPQEYNTGFITGALNLDFHDQNFYKTIQLLDRSRLYLIYCESGIRSEEAIIMMKELGFNNLIHMSEGMDGWKENKLKISKPEK